jgi:manganese efflux pump family protein
MRAARAKRESPGSVLPNLLERRGLVETAAGRSNGCSPKTESSARAQAARPNIRVPPSAQLVVAELIALVFPLGLDTFAVGAALGTPGVSPAHRLRISLLFTAFEAGMPLIGLAVGAAVRHAIGATADYIAIGVLLAFGLYMLLGSENDEQARLDRLTQMHGASALLLGISVSLDELAIGFTLGLLRLPAGLVIVLIVLIALQAFILTQLGLRLGNRLSERLREGAERVAGLALTALGLVLLGGKLLS